MPAEAAASALRCVGEGQRDEEPPRWPRIPVAHFPPLLPNNGLCLSACRVDRLRTASTVCAGGGDRDAGDGVETGYRNGGADRESAAGGRADARAATGWCSDSGCATNPDGKSAAGHAALGVRAVGLGRLREHPAGVARPGSGLPRPRHSGRRGHRRQSLADKLQHVQFRDTIRRCSHVGVERDLIARLVVCSPDAHLHVERFQHHPFLLIGELFDVLGHGPAPGRNLLKASPCQLPGPPASEHVCALPLKLLPLRADLL
jgi:hypothetical protein